MGKVWDVLAPRNLELGPLAGSASGQGNWRNWKLARDDNGIAWLVLDNKFDLRRVRKAIRISRRRPVTINRCDGSALSGAATIRCATASA